mmetsp:Transcript_10852/g.24556  ORF Transcript_10852/g.24556 Transcript_10852/m.24556 type:complete len:945 (-) Transcript_10852:16-2850(-)
MCRSLLLVASLAVVQCSRTVHETFLLGADENQLHEQDTVVNKKGQAIDTVTGFTDGEVDETDPAWKYSPTHQTSWQVAWFLLLFVAVALVRSIFYMSSSRATNMFRHRCTSAWVSCLQLVVLTLPLIVKDWRERLPPKIVPYWMVMAFWNAFSNADCYGTFVQYAFNMYLGCFLGSLSMACWNYVFPGGVPCLHAPECPEHTTWLLGRQAGVVLSIAYVTVCNYLILVSQLWIDTKRTFLLTTSSLFCSFICPSSDWTDFSPFIIDWNGRVAFCGAGVWCSLCVLLGFLIRGPLQYWLPMKVMTQGAISYSCLDHLEDGITKRIPEYVQALGTILDWTDPSATFDAESIRTLLDNSERELGCLRVLASEAEWEVVLFAGRLRHFKWCLDILDDIAKQSRFLLLLAEETFDANEDAEEQRVHEATAPYLKNLLDVYSGTLWALFDVKLSPEDRSTKVTAGTVLAASLLERIMEEVRTLHLSGAVSSEEAREQLAFFYACGMWTFTTGQALPRRTCTEIEPWAILPHIRSYFTSTITMRSQHIYAVTITSAWMAAFLFSNYYCHHRPTAVCTMSLMIINKKRILDIFDRLGIRLLGLSLGVVTANIPAYLLCRHYTSFRHLPEDLISYLSIMLILWGLLMYGTLVGGKYIYTFQTWAGFGSVELLRPLLIIYQEGKPPSQSIKETSFNSIIYSSVGMMIMAIALVMMVFFTGLFSKDPAAQSLSQALKGAQRLVDGIRAGGEDTEEASEELRRALVEVQEVAEDINQTAYLLSDDVSGETVQLVLTHCKTAESMAQSLKMLQGSVSVNLTEVMTRLLAEPSNLGLLADFVEKSLKVKQMKAYKKPSLRDRVFSACKKAINLEDVWSEQLQEAANAQQLKELAATWSFEISAQFINNTLAKIQVYMVSHEQRQQLSQARATASFGDICQSAEQILETRPRVYSEFVK